MNTTILFMRHEAHGKGECIKQQLMPDAIERARARGKALKEKGIKIDAAYSSAQPRAYSTVIETLTGYGKLIPIRTDDRFGDLVIGGVDPEPIKAVAKQLEVEPEDLCITPEKVSDEFVQIMLKRGHEGADALRELAAKHPGQTIIVGSHGGSKMEASILVLKHPRRDIFLTSLAQFGEPAKMFGRGEICRLVIDAETGALLEEEYLNLE